MTTMTTTGVLAAAVGAARRASDERARGPARAAIQRRAAAAQPRPRALAGALARPGLRIIAECKRRSPSRGILRRDYDPAAIATGYARAGAAAISVLTEPTFFDGSLEHLAAVRAAVDLPLLRKDFIVTTFQLVEARAAGADAVLLIVAALTDDELTGLVAETAAHGLGALVEAHDVVELRRALAAGASLVGVNCRDLRTLAVDPGVFETVAREWPQGTVAVAESGIRSTADAVALRDLGYRGFLIGERFMAAADPGAALESFLAGAQEAAR
jgi:indole-3-glycerol phosphate synthase